MESFKKAIKFWEKDKPDNIVELDSRLENWNVPIVCKIIWFTPLPGTKTSILFIVTFLACFKGTAIPEKPNYHVKDLPVDATSDNATDFRLLQRLQMKVRGEVQVSH